MAGMLNMQNLLGQDQPAVQQQFVAQPEAMTLPNFPVQQPQFSPMQGYGASRFLSGNAPIPLDFNVPQVSYTPMQFEPGRFSEFLKVEAKDSVPVYNPITRTYTASRPPPPPPPPPSYDSGGG